MGDLCVGRVSSEALRCGREAEVVFKESKMAGRVVSGWGDVRGRKGEGGVEVRLIYQGGGDNGIVAFGMTQRTIVCLDTVWRRAFL